MLPIQMVYLPEFELLPRLSGPFPIYFAFIASKNESESLDGGDPKNVSKGLVGRQNPERSGPLP